MTKSPEEVGISSRDSRLHRRSSGGIIADGQENIKDPNAPGLTQRKQPKAYNNIWRPVILLQSRSGNVVLKPATVFKRARPF